MTTEIAKVDVLEKLAREEIKKIKQANIFLGNYPISPNETMKWEGEVDNYYYHGKSAVNLIDSVLRLLYRNPEDIHDVLDFPCGHGRVLRGLRSYFRSSNIYACDLDTRGVDFCASKLGAIAVPSNIDLNKVKLGSKIDLIWCGSLLTHINSDKWEDFFQFFDSILREQGILIFTYAGSYVKELVQRGDHNFIDDDEAKSALKSYESNGFGFMQYSTHKNEYGRTICSPLWVRKFLNSFGNYRVVVHSERGWSARQDVVAMVKET